MEDRIDFLELYERMFQLLPSGNIQKLMELANDITGVSCTTCLASLLR